MFVAGEIGEGRRVAIVGARAASGYGVHWAGALSTGLARSGVTVVSGGARGVDIAAHRAALAAGGRTIAVLASGLDVPYPRAHAADFQRIARSGALVTEYPNGTTPRRHHFHARNRVIAEMSEAVVVVEGTLASGALITARFARELGRRLFAVPGDVGSPLCAAPHRLIREGATLVESVEGFLGALGLSTRDAVAVSQEADPIARALSRGPATVDELAERTGLAAGVAMAMLTSREMRGVVRRASDGRYHRVGGEAE